MDKGILLNTAGCECYRCERRVLVFHNGPIVDPPKGWVLFDYGEGRTYCPECAASTFGTDEFRPSTAEYFAVIEVAA